MVTNGTSNLENKYFVRTRKVLSNKLINDEFLTLIINSCETKEELSLIVRLMASYQQAFPLAKDGLLFFHRAINSSDYTAKEWIKAIIFFSKWLSQNERVSSIDKMTEYIQCSTQSPENKFTKYELASLVKKMLDEHGFIGK